MPWTSWAQPAQQKRPGDCWDLPEVPRKETQRKDKSEVVHDRDAAMDEEEAREPPAPQRGDHRADAHADSQVVGRGPNARRGHSASRDGSSRQRDHSRRSAGGATIDEWQQILTDANEGGCCTGMAIIN